MTMVMSGEEETVVVLPASGADGKPTEESILPLIRNEQQRGSMTGQEDLLQRYGLWESYQKYCLQPMSSTFKDYISHLPGVPPTERSELRKLAKERVKERLEDTTNSLASPPPGDKKAPSVRKQRKHELRRLQAEAELIFGSTTADEKRFNMSLYGALFQLSRPEDVAQGIDPNLLQIIHQEDDAAATSATNQRYRLPAELRESFQLKEGVKAVRPKREKKRRDSGGITIAGPGAPGGGAGLAEDSKKRKKKAKKSDKKKSKKKSRSTTA